MKKAFYIIVSLFVAVSCADVNVEPEPQDNPEISLNVSSLSFLNSGEAIDGASVVVESSAGWTLIGRTDWCHPSVTEGTSGETVTFTADVNSGADSRTTEFSFVCGSKTVKLHVMQKQTDAIELYKDEFSIPASGGQIVVRASATDEVSVNIPDEYSGWIELASDSGTASAASGNVVTKGMDLNVFYFNINETDKYNAREGRIAFTSGANTVWAEISQDKKIELSVDNASYSVGPDGGTVTVTVRTNLPYSVDVPQTTSSWLTPNLDPDSSEAPDDLVTRTEKFVAGPQSEMSRAGRITLTSLEGNLTTTFFIIQKGSSPKVIEIQDENFRKALDELAFVITEGYTDTRCELSDLGQNSTEMNVSGKNIRSIDGISNFPNVTTLDCSNNLITVLDLRGTNVWSAYGTGSKIYGNPLEEIHGNPRRRQFHLCPGRLQHLKFRTARLRPHRLRRHSIEETPCDRRPGTVCVCAIQSVSGETRCLILPEDEQRLYGRLHRLRYIQPAVQGLFPDRHVYPVIWHSGEHRIHRRPAYGLVTPCRSAFACPDISDSSVYCQKNTFDNSLSQLGRWIWPG